jgi:hypothetical protein
MDLPSIVVFLVELQLSTTILRKGFKEIESSSCLEINDFLKL